VKNGKMKKCHQVFYINFYILSDLMAGSLIAIQLKQEGAADLQFTWIENARGLIPDKHP
jgi:hypothetical protein